MPPSGAAGAAAERRALPLTAWERATGMAIGGGGLAAGPRPAGGASPRAALDSVLARALARPPCVVSFSGGRDSSVVLAAAVATARREGLAPPVAVTLRFAGVATAEESGWQELVVSHLGLGDWERIVIGDELDLIGPVARSGLHAHGLLWPPNTHLHVPILERARGGGMLTGWDGDGLFGSWRWARAQAVIHRRTDPRPRDLLRVGLALAPPAVRRPWMRPAVLGATPWVRAERRPELAALLGADAAREPRRWDERIDHYRGRRYLALGIRSLELLARERDVEVCHPLLHPAFLTALGRDGGAAGYGGRTTAMGRLFGDLLPAALIERPGKAEFGRALWSGESRAYARAWAGGGVDPARVDPERLAREWTLPSPRFGAATLLQLAWLAAQGPQPK
ncbi:MAG: asparagine synthase-related protein [Solirubrobacteraceae bacterium]